MVNLVKESIDDVLKGKTDEQIRSDFQKEYGMEYSEMEETVERLKAIGIDARKDKIDWHDKKQYPTIKIFLWEIKNSNNGNQWAVIGTTMTERAANEIIEVLKNRLNIGESKPYQYERQKENFPHYFSNMDALKLLTKLQNES
jgi:hypothetical protein